MNHFCAIAYIFYTITRDPMEDLGEKDRGKEERKEAVEFAAKDGHGEEGLADGEPAILLDVLSN